MTRDHPASPYRENGRMMQVSRQISGADTTCRDELHHRERCRERLKHSDPAKGLGGEKLDRIESRVQCRLDVGCRGDSREYWHRARLAVPHNLGIEAWRHYVAGARVKGKVHLAAVKYRTGSDHEIMVGSHCPQGHLGRGCPQGDLDAAEAALLERGGERERGFRVLNYYDGQQAAS